MHVLLANVNTDFFPIVVIRMNAICDPKRSFLRFVVVVRFLFFSFFFFFFKLIEL